METYYGNGGHGDLRQQGLLLHGAVPDRRSRRAAERTWFPAGRSIRLYRRGSPAETTVFPRKQQAGGRVAAGFGGVAWAGLWWTIRPSCSRLSAACVRAWAARLPILSAGHAWASTPTPISFIRTGQIDSKFGFTLENGRGAGGGSTTRWSACRAWTLKGSHCHIGSQIFDDGALYPRGGGDAHALWRRCAGKPASR